jgi:hypothetical protein
MEEEQTMDNWKQFHGTELGGLLSKIYGNENRPVINYPKPKVKPRTQTDPYLPVGGKVGATDPRKATRKDVNVEVPKVGVGASNIARRPMIANVQRRKNEAIIKNELEDIKMRNALYRPAYVKPVSTEAEKEKLSQINTFHGGKALPAEGLHPEGEAPFERQARLKEEERMTKLRNKYNPTPAPRQAPALSNKETLAQMISDEITERCDHLEFLERGNGNRQEIAAIKMEIVKRTKELQKLERNI